MDSKTCWRCGKQLSGAHTCIPRPELREEIKKAEKKARVEVAKDILDTASAYPKNRDGNLLYAKEQKCIEIIEQNKE